MSLFPSRLFTLLFTCIVCAISSSSTHASTLDQSNTDPWGILGVYQENLAFTFTNGLTGTLDHIDIVLARTIDPGEVTLEVRNMAGGTLNNDPSGLLFTQTLVIADLVHGDDLNWSAIMDDKISFDVSASNIAVTPGEVLAVVISTDNYVQFVVSEANYPGGEIHWDYNETSGSWWSSITEDFDPVFETYVTVPEPVSLVLLSILATGSLVRRQS